MTTVVLLPGLHGTSHLFGDLVEALGPGHEALRVSYPEDRPLDYPALVDLVRAKLPRDRPFVLLGESFSGPIAITLAAEHPPGLVGLVLCVSFARNPRPLLGPARWILGLVPLAPSLADLLTPVMLGRFVTPALRGMWCEAGAALPVSVLRTRLRAILGVDVSPLLAGVEVPLLYVRATEDRLVPASASRLVARLRPDVEIADIEAPHLLLQTAPHAAARCLERFFARAEEAAPGAVSKRGPQAALLVTAVVGAGPAGLLFCAISKLLHQRHGGQPDEWPIRLFDSRETYVRTHRLRLAPEPFVELQRDLSDPRFDAFVRFLEKASFQPEVNLLEARLSALVAELGIVKQRLVIGGGAGETPLGELRRLLEADGTLKTEGRLTIVAADSVHSSVRELVRGDAEPKRHVHQRVGRLRIAGPGLPAKLPRLVQARLAKVLGSIVDYRLNANGFAEVDLFLPAGEHAVLRGLGASPKAPLILSSATLSPLRAPLFTRLVHHFERGFGAGPCEVSLQSIFQLEHSLMPTLVFERRELRAHVFLVGDAAVSLPFFRGMACLVRCAHRLAHAHHDLMLLQKRRESPALSRADTAEIERFFRSPNRPTRFGAWLLPGTILEARRTVWRGRSAVAVLHRFAGLYGSHLLVRQEDESWRALSHVAPVPRRFAERDFAARLDPAWRYDREADEVKRREIGVVSARGRLVRLTSEIIRVSGLLPFPIQSWLLTQPDDAPAQDPRNPLSRGAVINAVLATLAAGLALLPPALEAAGRAPGSAFFWAYGGALGVQALGGVAYHAALTLETGPHRWVRAIWRLQTIVLFAVGMPLAIFALGRVGAWTALFSASAWLALAAMFVVGLYVYERVVARFWERAELGEEQA